MGRVSYSTLLNRLRSIDFDELQVNLSSHARNFRQTFDVNVPLTNAMARTTM